MSKTKTQTIKIDEIKATFYVRRELNEGRVSQLIKFAQAGVILPPITVWWNDTKSRYELIDGRHRLEMANRLDWTDIKAEIVDEPDIANRVCLAVAANVDGPLTPTDEDYSAAIETLIDSGISRKKILDSFPLPKSYTLKLFHDTQARRTKVLMNKAANAVANGRLNVSQAAEKFSVDESNLRTALFPKGQGKRQKSNITDFTGGFTKRFRSFSQANWANYRQLFDSYEAGHLTADDVRKILKNVSRSFKQATSGLEDWRARFEVEVHEAEDPSEADAAKDSASADGSTEARA